MSNDPIEFEEGEPVKGFPIKFRWRKGIWFDIFQEHVDLIQQDIRRAHAEDRVVVYLSCPISGHGGGHHRTNVEIANHTARRLMLEWGHRFWILNPCQYQMESKEGTGLIKQHAKKLGLEKKLKILPKPTGGDYMRMWTRVLVEDGEENKPSVKNLGIRFDAYYFLGPGDVRDFFTEGGATTVTAGIEEYFSRKFSMDPDFREDFLCGGNHKKRAWEERRKDFFRFYAVRASAHFSMGSHDEWNIWWTLNELRIKDKKFGPGSQIAGYFDGKQIDPGAAESMLSQGYEGEIKKK